MRDMRNPRLAPAEIVERLRIVEKLVAEGRPIVEALRSVKMTEVAYERWRKEYGGLLRTLGPIWDGRAKGAERARPTGKTRPTKPHS